jgi:hypothetical protein
MPPSPQESRKYTGALSAARANTSDTRYTIQQKILRKRNPETRTSVRQGVYREQVLDMIIEQFYIIYSIFITRTAPRPLRCATEDNPNWDALGLLLEISAILGDELGARSPKAAAARDHAKATR